MKRKFQIFAPLSKQKRRQHFPFNYWFIDLFISLLTRQLLKQNTSSDFFVFLVFFLLFFFLSISFFWSRRGRNGTKITYKIKTTVFSSLLQSLLINNVRKWHESQFQSIEGVKLTQHWAEPHSFVSLIYF